MQESLGFFSKIQCLHIKQKTTQHWLEINLSEFIAAQDWPSGSLEKISITSTDLNLLDYRLWSILEKVYSKPHRHIKSLKLDLIKPAITIKIQYY